MSPKDETNHIYYKTWKDKGGNIGVQCIWEECTQPTFWTGKEPYGKVLKDKTHPELGERDCLNCQAIIKTDLLKIENERHKGEGVTSADECQHQPSQL